MTMADVVAPEAFETDWAVPPGGTIAAILSARSLSRERFATAIGESVETVQRLLLGLESVDEDLANRLSVFLGSSQAFWLSREAQYRSDVDRKRQREGASSLGIWVKQFPVREMASLGWIPNFHSPTEAARECLRFFGVPDPASWQSRFAGSAAVAAFRMSPSLRANPGAVTAWLRWAEMVASRTPCAHWNPELFLEKLQSARRLTWQKDPASFLPTLRKLCAEAGVAVVIARTPRGCPASGATRFLSPTQAMMVLSFRYRSDDQFWFTFFHEAGHLILHGLDALFLEDESESTSDAETEANDFAEKMLIPSEKAEGLAIVELNKEAIMRFARKVGIAPGLVVGQLQHIKRIAPSQFNWLKRRYVWDQIESDQIIP